LSIGRAKRLIYTSIAPWAEFHRDLTAIKVLARANVIARPQPRPRRIDGAETLPYKPRHQAISLPNGSTGPGGAIALRILGR